MTQAIDVTPDQRKTLLSLLANHLPNTEAWVYGSRVRWTSRPESDLDMAVFATPSQAHGVSALRDALEASDLPFRVDLLVWDEMPDNFRKQILREHVVLAEANEVQSTRRVFGTGASSDVGNEWRESTWGEEITLEYGKALRGHATSTGAYRVFGSNGPIGWTDKALAPGPGVILGRKGAYRGVQYSPDPFFVIDTAYYVVPKSQHDMRWLYFAIKHYKLGEIDDGSPIPSTTRAAVYPRKLFIPSFPEQRSIARILGTLDDKIELNRRMSETLEAVARAIFKDWFVDFGPVRAKMDGQAPYLPPEIWRLFPDSLGNDDKPKGWAVRTLDDLIEINPARRLRKGQLAPYLDMANMPIQGHVPGVVVDRPFGPECASSTEIRFWRALLRVWKTARRPLSISWRTMKLAGGLRNTSSCGRNALFPMNSLTVWPEAVDSVSSRYGA